MKLVAAKCPNCGASIKVDRSLKFTNCEYCNTQIIVEEAVENLIKVEFKDTPTLDNLLTLGDRYYSNKEYGEAYKAYSKAEEIDPNNPIVVLRKGLCKSMVTGFNDFDVDSAINGLKTSMDLMKKMKMSKKDINKSIDEVGACIYGSKNFLLHVYARNKLNKTQTSEYIDKLEACLNAFLYLDSIDISDLDLKHRIYIGIVETIDAILGDKKTTNYNLSTKFVNDLNNKKKIYLEYLGKDTSKSKYNATQMPDKVVDIETGSSKIKDILCYVAIFFISIMFLGSILNGESIIEILIWFLAIISFIPQIKKALMRRNGANIGKIIVIARIALLVIAFLILATAPTPFENTFEKDDVTISFESGKYQMINNDNIIDGDYHWDSKDNDYYIYVQTTDNNNYTYRYRDNKEGGSLCLFEDNKCITLYSPVN